MFDGKIEKNDNLYCVNRQYTMLFDYLHEKEFFKIFKIFF